MIKKEWMRLYNFVVSRLTDEEKFELRKRGFQCMPMDVNNKSNIDVISSTITIMVNVANEIEAGYSIEEKGDKLSEELKESS